VVGDGAGAGDYDGDGTVDLPCTIQPAASGTCANRRRATASNRRVVGDDSLPDYDGDGGRTWRVFYDPRVVLPYTKR
jgi:hypothetical protein